MATSVSGLLTLLFLIFIGPIIYLARYFFRKGQSRTESAVSPVEGGREVLKTREYMFALIGYAIGIGNVWRFPYVISQNGGSAALVAYLTCAVLVSVPLFLYEMIIGQYTGLSTIPTYTKIRPRWLSFGYAQALMLFLVQSYFSMIIAYTLPYIAASCQDPLPWLDDSEEYWKGTVLNKFDDLNEASGLGPIQPKLALSLFIVCCITYFSIAFGKHILANVTYVTVTMPVILIIIFVIRTAFLPGAGAGISFYIGKFEGKELLKLKVWATALSQILFSLSPGFGTAITYSSYAKPKEDVFKICMIVAVTNSVFSIIGGFGIFAMVGNMAFKDGVDVEEKAKGSGPGLAFIVIAEAMESFGAFKNVMAVLFFVMLLTLGLDSAFAWTETLVSIMDDTMVMNGHERLPTWKSSLIVSVALFLVGLIYTTRMGNEVLDVVDHYVGIVFLLVVCFIESVIFNIDFGYERLEKALQSATHGLGGLPEGRSLFPKYLCRLDFHFTVPVMTFGLALYTFIKDLQKPYEGYPSGLQAFGWTLLGLFFATIFMTIWKTEPSKLPPIEDDEKFKVDKEGIEA